MSMPPRTRGRVCLALLAALLHGSASFAQYQPAGHPRGVLELPPGVDPGCRGYPPGVMPGLPGVPFMPPADGQPRTEPGQQPQAPEQPTTPSDALAQAGGRGTLGDVGGSPPIFGDLIGIQASRIVVLPSGAAGGAAGGAGANLPPGVRLIGGNRAIVVAPVPFRGAFKITENESPRPTTRLYFNYNFFSDVDNAALLSSGVGGAGDFHRETVGFEYAFADGDASIGMRLPFFQLTGSSAVEDSEVADLSVLFKYAFINNRDTGNLASAGMVVTMPTAKGVNIQGESTIHPWLLQPYVGYIYNVSEDLYLQGFSSLFVPTDARDVTILFNSLAVGYRLYRNQDAGARLRGVVPIVETHVSTPLNHRGTDSGDPLFYPDTVNLTGGSFFQFDRATIGIAAGIPLTGPKPYDYEINASLNIRF
jgi:hypothetical protein